MTLKNKTIVIFGAGGQVGSTVAEEFANEGANVFLSGRNLKNVEAITKKITAKGGKAISEELDALDEAKVNAYLDRVKSSAGQIDVVLNLTGPKVDEYDNGFPAHMVANEKFVLPFNQIVLSNFITSKSASRHMLEQQSGTILFLSASPSKGVAPGTVSVAAGMGALESMMKVFASEWSPMGTRVTGVRSFGMIDTFTLQHTFGVAAHGMGKSAEEFTEFAKDWTLQKTFPKTTDTAKVLAFAASDNANTLTGAILNSSCGQVLD